MCKGPKVGLGGVGLESKSDQETWAAPGSQHRVVGERAWERPQEQSWHVPQHPPGVRAGTPRLEPQELPPGWPVCAPATRGVLRPWFGPLGQGPQVRSHSRPIVSPEPFGGPCRMGQRSEKETHSEPMWLGLWAPGQEPQL